MVSPYKNIQRPALTGVPRTAVLVVPSDAEDLQQVAKGLRIVNQTTSFQDLVFVSDTGDLVTFPIPPQSLLYEDVLVAAVKATGTGTLTIHAYMD